MAGPHALEDSRRTSRHGPSKGAGGRTAPRRSTSSGRPPEDLRLNLKPDLRTKLSRRQADRRLRQAVSNWAGRRPVFTLTGRLRASATFCAARNTIFQGAAADGAILGMWKLWRAGYRIVSFIHDQAVVEVREDDRLEERREQVAELMRRGCSRSCRG